MLTERRSLVEMRAQNRTIEGTVMRYGDEAVVVHPATGRMIRETFDAGAFAPYMAEFRTRLNLQHDAMTVVADTRPSDRGHLELIDSDTELRMRAVLPEGEPYDQVIDLVRAGDLQHTSVEFRPIHEAIENGVRRIALATLPGIAIVDRGAYRGGVEVRVPGRTVKGRLPLGRRLACECAGPSCSEVVFEAEAFKVLPTEALAVASNYGSPLASMRRGTLRLAVANESLEVEVDLQPGAAADAVVEADRAAGIFVRPFLDQEASEYEEANGVRTYSTASIRAVIVGSTDRTAGHEPAELVTAERRRAATPGSSRSFKLPPHRRRRWC